MYPATTPPKGAANLHGEIEYLGKGVFGTHWYAEAEDVTWHFVTAGQPTKEPILFIHGFPESWYCFHDVMPNLSKDYFVISIDQLGFGQSQKGLDIDYTHAAVAKKLAALLDKIQIKKFNLATHDRGSIIGDNLIGVKGMSDRVLRFIRMQQTGSEPHGLPLPSHEAFQNPDFLKEKDFIRNVFTSLWVTTVIPEKEIQRLTWEFGFEGLAESVAQSYHTSFDKELELRKGLFPHMTMPVLFLQGDQDPGQHPEEYAYITDAVVDGYVEFIEGNHYFPLEQPEELIDAIRRFLAK